MWVISYQGGLDEDFSHQIGFMGLVSHQGGLYVAKFSSGRSLWGWSLLLLCCFMSTEARRLIRDGDRGEGDERVKAPPWIPPERDRRDRGPPPEQWKC